MEPVSQHDDCALPVTAYREFAPRAELRPYVRAFFSFIPAAEAAATRRPVTQHVLFRRSDSYCSPIFAAGSPSIVFNLGRTCIAGVWGTGNAPRAEVVGAVTRAGHSSPSARPAMLGAYLNAAHATAFLGAPASELTDKVVALEDIWETNAGMLVEQVVELDESARIDALEAELMRRRVVADDRARPCVNVSGLVARIVGMGGQVSVESLASAAGVTRQHLARVFDENVGVSPKLFCRLTRFQSALRLVRAHLARDGAHVALELGYADQSHMIAEFREFCSLSPQQVASGTWFHPFAVAAGR